MDITVSKKDLIEAVSASMEFVSTSTTAPLLKNLLLTPGAKDLAITATDSERSSKFVLEISESKTAAGYVPTVVPATGLRDFIGGASGNVVRIYEEDKKVICKSGKSRISFRLPGEYRFPPTTIEDPDQTEIFTIEAEELSRLFVRTSFISRQGLKSDGASEGSVNLNGSFGVRLVAAGNVIATAYESVRVARVKSDTATSGHDCEFTVPPRAASWLSSPRWKKDSEVSVRHLNSGVVFTSGGFSVFFRTTNFPLPDMANQFSPDYKHKAVFNTDSFRHSIDSVSKFSESEGQHSKYRRVNIILRDKEAVISARSGIGDVDIEDAVWCSHNAPEGTAISFNPVFLTDFCRTQNSEKFSMKFNTPYGIMRFGHKDDNEFVYLAVAMEVR